MRKIFAFLADFIRHLWVEDDSDDDRWYQELKDAYKREHRYD